MTQENIILNHLKEHGSISSWTAITEYHITRLSAYILNLKKEGVKITDKWVIDYARGKKWKIYFLEREKNETI